MTDAPSKPPKEKKIKEAALTLVQKESLETMLHKINNEYAVIQRGNQVHVMRHWVGEDGLNKLVFMSRRDFLFLMENQLFFRAEGPPVNIGKAWLCWTHRRGFEEVYFEPNGPEFLHRYNLWRGFAVKPKKGGKFNIFLDHVKQNICNGDEVLFTWLMAWIADLFQNPSNKPGTAIVLRGEMGVGKGQFANHIGRLLGLHYMSITQPSQLTGRFNGHMMDKVLMFIDEGWWSDDRSGVGVLNALITEHQIAVEMKGRDAVFIPNFTRFIIAANADRVVQTGIGDERRYAFLDVGALVKQNKEYFAAMDAELKDVGYEALLDYLLSYQYDKSLPRTIPQTAALQDHKLYSMPEEAKWINECLIVGKINDFIIHDSDSWDNKIEVDKFYKSYVDWCALMKVKPLALNVLPKKLKKFMNMDKKQGKTENGDRCFYHFAKLGIMRQDFSDFIRSEIDWN